MPRTCMKRNGIHHFVCFSKYFFFHCQSFVSKLSFSYAAAYAAKGDINQLLLSPVSVVRAAEIPAIGQKQGKYLPMRRVPHRGLILGHLNV